MSVYSWTTLEPVLKNCQCSTLALLLEPCSFLVQMARYAQLDKKQPVTWFWKTSRSFKAIVRCWPFPTCMTKDQFRRRRHNCRRVLKYCNLICSLICHSIIVSNKGNKNFMLSVLYTRCPPARAFVSDQVGGALVPWRQAGVLSGLCWALSGNWSSSILGFCVFILRLGTFLKHAQSCWDLYLGLICLNQLGKRQIIS